MLWDFFKRINISIHLILRHTTNSFLGPYLMHMILSSSQPPKTHSMCIFSLFDIRGLKGGLNREGAYFKFWLGTGGLIERGLNRAIRYDILLNSATIFSYQYFHFTFHSMSVYLIASSRYLYCKISHSILNFSAPKHFSIQRKF